MKKSNFAKQTLYKINPEFDANDKDTFYFAEQAEQGAYFHRLVDGDENVIDENWSYFTQAEIDDNVLIEA